MRNFEIGLQLYSIRDEMAKDVDSALKAVSEMGYDFVEPAGLAGKTAKEFKAILDKYNLKAHSIHLGYTTIMSDPEKNIEDLKTLGVKYCVIPWMGVEFHKGSDGFDKAVSDIISVSKLLKDNGIELLYHNHSFEFDVIGNKFLLNWLFEEVGEEYIKPEFDTCWIKYAGIDPCEYIKDFAGKMDCLHFKDFSCDNLLLRPVNEILNDPDYKPEPLTRVERNFKFQPVGYGMQNLGELISLAEKCGTKYLIVEQDQFYGGSSLEDARLSINSIRKEL